MNIAADARPANGHAIAAPQPEALLDRVVEATHAARQYTVEELRYMAMAASRSGMFGMTEPQAFVLMQICEAEGLHPIQAVRRYDVIDGKPALKAAAMQAEFTRRGGRIVFRERTNEACEADFSHPRLRPEPLRIRWTLEELKKSGVALARDGSLKKNYRTFPRALLHARVISEGVRAVDPAIVVGLYTPEEIADMDDDRPEARPPAPTPPKPPRPVPKPAPPDPDPAPQLGPPAPTISDAGYWMQAEIDQANANWAMTCGLSKIDYRPLCRHVKHAINGVIEAWINARHIHPDAVTTDDKRDWSKVRTLVRGEWDDDRDGFQSAVKDWLGAKLEEAAKAAGINLDADPPSASGEGRVTDDEEETP